MLLLSKVRGPLATGSGTFVCDDIEEAVGRSGHHYENWGTFRNGRDTLGVSACIYEDASDEHVRIYGGTVAPYSGMYPMVEVASAFVRIAVPPVTDPRAPYDCVDVTIDFDGDGTNPTFTISHPLQANWELCLLGMVQL